MAVGLKKGNCIERKKTQKRMTSHNTNEFCEGIFWGPLAYTGFLYQWKRLRKTDSISLTLKLNILGIENLRMLFLLQKLGARSEK
jgi:hypothetical protein